MNRTGQIWQDITYAPKIVLVISSQPNLIDPSHWEHHVVLLDRQDLDDGRIFWGEQMWVEFNGSVWENHVEMKRVA